jgi:hypothetical protein
MSEIDQIADSLWNATAQLVARQDSDPRPNSQNAFEVKAS